MIQAILRRILIFCMQRSLRTRRGYPSRFAREMAEKETDRILALPREEMRREAYRILENGI